MIITLEALSKEKKIRQAKAVNELINNEMEWLKDSYPKDSARFGTLPRAIKNISRLALSQDVVAYIVRDGREPIGMASIVINQTIVHPKAGQIRGNCLDYWLTKHVPGDEHDITAYELMDMNDELYAELHGTQASFDPVFGTIDPASSNCSVGLRSIMEPVGLPASLKTLTGTDPFGITKEGKTLQLLTNLRIEQQAA